jgi:stress response protein YsnF
VNRHESANGQTASAGATEDVPASRAANVEIASTFELLEERAVVSTQRERVGSYTVSRQVRLETVQVAVELRREVLVVTRSPVVAVESGAPGEHTVLEVEGQPVRLAPGESVSVEIYAETPVVQKVARVAEHVTIGKRTVSEPGRVSVELGREALLVRDELTGSDLTGSDLTGSEVRDRS